MSEALRDTVEAPVDFAVAAQKFLDDQGGQGEWYNTSLGTVATDSAEVFVKLPGEAGKVSKGYIAMVGGELQFVPRAETEVEGDVAALRGRMEPYFLANMKSTEQIVQA